MRALFTVLLSCAMTWPVQAATIDKQILGHWKIVSVADFAGIGADTDEADSKRLLGAELVIAPHSVRFDGEECKNPKYKAGRKTLAQAFRIGFQLEDTKKLQLPDPVIEIETNCENATAISLLYVRSRSRIVLVWSGIFFNAVKQE